MDWQAVGVDVAAEGHGLPAAACGGLSTITELNPAPEGEVPSMPLTWDCSQVAPGSGRCLGSWPR
jgi:hypothetical protein